MFCASDGLAGVQLAQQCLPDLILCDVTMPELDGYGTLTALRQEQCHGHDPIRVSDGDLG